jgi:hypothetical protein
MGNIEGRGHLRSLTLPNTVYDVHYAFTTVQHMVRRSGLPSALGHADSSGIVHSLDGQFIPDGVFELEMATGKSAGLRT